MAATINSYINGLVQAGFVPNVKVATHKRDFSAPDQSEVKRAATPPTPNINLVLSLLKNHGFQPATTTKGHKARDVSDEGSSLSFAKRAAALVVKSAIAALPERAIATFTRRALANVDKRAIPDITLVVSLLEAQGFYPHAGAKVSRRSLAEDRELIEKSSPIDKRQDAGDVNTVINGLLNYGYQPADFGPTASKMISSYLSTMPVSKTAVCPQNNNTIYTTGGQTFELQCGFGYDGNDLPHFQTKDFASCLAACASYVPQPYNANGAKCVAASWAAIGDLTQDCHLKYAVSAVTQGNTVYNNRSCGRIIGT